MGIVLEPIKGSPYRVDATRYLNAAESNLEKIKFVKN